MNEEKRAFERDGYVIIPSVLDNAEVAEFRELLKNVFDSNIDPKKGDRKLIRSDVLSRYPEIRRFFFQDKIFNEAKKVLGEKILVLPEVSVMESQFGGWHKDTTSIEVLGFDFHKEDDFNVVNLAIYLQDNDEFGGGLDVVPGSHLVPDPYTKPMLEVYAKDEGQFFLKKYMSKYFRSIQAKLFPSTLNKDGDEVRRENYETIKLDAMDSKENKIAIESKAGDMVIFDLRLDHKASWPKQALNAKNHQPKYAFFAIMAGEGSAATKYKNYILTRAKTQYAYQYLFNMKTDKALISIAKKFNAEFV